MNKKVALIIFTLVFLLLAVVEAQFIILATLTDAKVSEKMVIASPRTIWVPDNYTRIQWAIGNASDGDAIRVRAGTYYEHLTINKSLALIGEDRSSTIIDGNGTGAVIRITANTVHINGFTVRNGSSGWIFNDDAIYINNCSGITISGNVITSNFMFGIWLENASGNTIIDNQISNNGHWPPLGGGGGIQLIRSDNNVIRDNVITSNRVGVYLDRSHNNTVIGNVMSNNSMDFSLSYSDGNIVSGNIITLSEGGIGVDLYGSSGNIISNNTIIGSKIFIFGGEGIRLWRSHNNTVVGNNISGSYYGSFTGLDVRVSDGNTFVGNTVSGCEVGIILDDSRGNIIYHNNFINNIQQVDLVHYLYVSANVWDTGYSSGGNYWSNYAGLDMYSGPYQNETGSDGIGDIPYIIDENNTDNYPLMGMFSGFTVTLEEETHHVTTVSNSTVSAFHFNQTTRIISFNVTGPEGTMGFCRVMFLRTLLSDGPYNVTVDGLPPLTLKELSISNSTHAFLYFTYVHSTREVKIFPEFPTALILPLLIITAIAVTILRKMTQPSKKPTSLRQQ